MHRYAKEALSYCNLLSLISVLPFLCAKFCYIQADKSITHIQAVQNKRYKKNLNVLANYFAFFTLILNSVVINGLIFGGIGCVVSQKPLGEIFAISFGASAVFASAVLAMFVGKNYKKSTNFRETIESAVVVMGAITLPGLLMATGAEIVENCLLQKTK